MEYSGVGDESEDGCGWVEGESYEWCNRGITKANASLLFQALSIN